VLVLVTNRLDLDDDIVAVVSDRWACGVRDVFRWCNVCGAADTRVRSQRLRIQVYVALIAKRAHQPAGRAARQTYVRDALFLPQRVGQ